MSYSIFSIPPFEKQLKKLVEKLASLKTEYGKLIKSLEINPVQGNALIKNCYKIRLAIASKGKGKSGGARVIIHFQKVDNIVYLLAIYDKSNQENITNKELEFLLSFIE